MFNLLHLAELFRQNKVTASLQRNYLWVFALLTMWAIMSTLFSPSTLVPFTSLEEKVFAGAVTILSIFGPLFCFMRANGQGDGKDPLVRYTLLSFDAYLQYGFYTAILLLCVSVFPFMAGILARGPWVVFGGIFVFHLILAVHMSVAGRLASGAK